MKRIYLILIVAGMMMLLLSEETSATPLLLTTRTTPPSFLNELSFPVEQNSNNQLETSSSSRNEDSEESIEFSSSTPLTAQPSSLPGAQHQLNINSQDEYKAQIKANELNEEIKNIKASLGQIRSSVMRVELELDELGTRITRKLYSTPSGGSNSTSVDTTVTFYNEQGFEGKSWTIQMMPGIGYNAYRLKEIEIRSLKTNVCVMLFEYSSCLSNDRKVQVSSNSPQVPEAHTIDNYYSAKLC